MADPDAQQNGICYGDGDRYIGNVSWTWSNTSCHTWSDTCGDTSFIDHNNMKDIDTNYCRNPTGNRQKPWCYTNRNTSNWEYCDIPHCPSVDGNYGVWSSYSMCSGPCWNATRNRTRTCDNPVPKYSGRNCSHLGVDMELAPCNNTICTQGIAASPIARSNSLVYILIPALMVLTVAVSVSLLWIHRRGNKRDKIEPYLEIPFTSENIQELITLDYTCDEMEIIQQIQDHMRNFSRCLCSTCIGAWLFNLVRNSGYKENDQLKDTIKVMLTDLENIEGYSNMSRACCSPSSHADDAVESDKLCKVTENDTLLREAVEKWVKKQTVYDKLNPCTRTTHLANGNYYDGGRVLFGSFEISGSTIVPLYDKLNKIRSNPNSSEGQLDNHPECTTTIDHRVIIHIASDDITPDSGNISPDNKPDYSRISSIDKTVDV